MDEDNPSRNKSFLSKFCPIISVLVLIDFFTYICLGSWAVVTGAIKITTAIQQLDLFPLKFTIFGDATELHGWNCNYM